MKLCHGKKRKNCLMQTSLLQILLGEKKKIKNKKERKEKTMSSDRCRCMEYFPCRKSDCDMIPPYWGGVAGKQEKVLISPCPADWSHKKCFIWNKGICSQEAEESQCSTFPPVLSCHSACWYCGKWKSLWLLLPGILYPRSLTDATLGQERCGKESQNHLAPPCLPLKHVPRRHVHLLLNTSRDGDSNSASDSLFQGLTRNFS